ncbi:MAG: DoxX family protein [Candidatus Marinimicrobia bacterium]|jgi:putative oxidoreductase|nr:DoxX family protein [Candidatus Neomarinimicrobiota bacterium]
MNFRPWFFSSTNLSQNGGILLLRISSGGLLLMNHGWDKIISGADKWTGLGRTGLMPLGIEYFHTFFGFMAAFSESICAVLVVIGLLTRPAAALITVTMFVGANFHISLGKGSPEMALMYGIIFLSIGLLNPGKYSLDHFIFNKDR